MADENIKYIHAVHSAKGGSGKSSFSFTLANVLFGKELDEEPTDNREEHNQVLLFDADFKGTSFKSIFSKNKTNNSIFIEADEKKTFDQLIDANVFDLDNYITKCIVKNKADPDDPNSSYKYKLINMCFSSGRNKDKRKFYYSKKQNNTEQLGVERFSEWFENLLNNIHTVYENRFKHLIFDLSPSTDEYTESMLNTFEEVSDNSKYVFIHYVVVTDDSAHIDATVEYIADLLSGSMRSEDNRKIVIVFNQIYEDNLFKEINKGEMDINSIYSEIIKNIYTKIGDKVNNEKIKEISFICMPFNKNYFVYSRSGTVTTNEKYRFTIKGCTLNFSDDSTDKVVNVKIAESTIQNFDDLSKYIKGLGD